MRKAATYWSVTASAPSMPAKTISRTWPSTRDASTPEPTTSAAMPMRRFMELAGPVITEKR